MLSETALTAVSTNSQCIAFCKVLILLFDSVQNIAPAVSAEKPEVGLVALDSALQEQERIITMSYALASEASLKSKLVTGWSFYMIWNHFL